MNETLTVRDFGPIREATVEFKRVTVFIGPTGGGKSTLAKLAAVCRNDDFLLDLSDEDLEGIINNGLDHFKIESFAKPRTFLSWYSEWHGWSLKGNGNGLKRQMNQAAKVKVEAVVSRIAHKNRIRISSGKPVLTEEIVAQLFDKMSDADRDDYCDATTAYSPNVTYVPAERIVAGLFAKAAFTFQKSKVIVPDTLLNFLSDFEAAREEITRLPIPFLGVNYEFRNDQHLIVTPDGSIIDLIEAASGVQGVTPLLLVIEYMTRNPYFNSFIIEEPELNLFPEAQQALLNLLIEKCAQADGKNDLIITTHSPYLLSQLNLLLYAPQVAKNHPERAGEVMEMVPVESWIEPGDLAVYYVGEGGVRSLLDPETGLIAQNALDGTAGKQADAFDRLLDINSGF